jgi:hydroxyethylthiazole kinase-like uncharacterized protein yjeF
MQILSAQQIKELDDFTCANEPITSINLMERAAEALCEEIGVREGYLNLTIICGKGNNGGDGLALARLISKKGIPVQVIVVDYTTNSSPNFLINLKRLPKKNIAFLETKELPTIPPDNIIIDALLGTGLSRPLSGVLADVVQQINSLPNRVISIDIPTGLFCEDNSGNDSKLIVQAEQTLTFHCPKLSFMFAENATHVGHFSVLDIGLLEQKSGVVSANKWVKEKDVRALLRPRYPFSHKGTFGHGLLLVGRYGSMGAAVLSAKACMRSGVGLVTVHVPALGVSVLQTAIPEVMCSVDTGDASIESLPKLDHFSAIGMGPGIGKEKDTANALKRLLQDCNVSLVLDADALNILSENKTWLSFLPANTVLSPHPKEFDRLAGPSESGHERWKKQREFAMRYNCVVVLKGAYTSVCNPAGQTFFNSTGNAGMATAGSGDALTGLIVGLLAQGYSPTEASIVGVYLHGLAGDIAAKKHGQEAMIASDIIKAIGSAFLRLTT